MKNRLLKKASVFFLVGIIALQMFFQFIFIADAAYVPNSASQTFFGSLGHHKEYVFARMEAFENEKGTKIYTRSSDFQKMLKEHLSYQRNWDRIFGRFALPASLVD